MSHGTTGQGAPLDVVAFSGANSRAYLRAVFAAYRAGQVVLALPQAPKIRALPGVTITDRQSFEDDPGWFDEPLDLAPSDAPAQISFSSGTTGRPKALLLSHRALADVVRRINTAMGVTEEIREYVGVPVTFSFGFGRVRAVAAAGGRSFLPEHGFDPTEIARMLKAGEINAISAVPTLWRVVLANPDVIGTAGAAVRWIEIGSQYMAADEKAGLKRLFPNAKIVQHYGLTEASRSTLLDISAAPDTALESVGEATGDVGIAIAEDGAIRIRGPHLAEGLVTGAGLKPITDADGWLTTSDRGRIADGLLYYEGRMDELINSGGIKIDPTQFEQRLLAGLGISEGAAVGRLADPLRGEKVLVVLKADAGIDHAQAEAVALGIAADCGLTGAGSLALREVADIPLTATGKVQRAELADLADLAAAPPAPVEQASGTPTRATELQKVWAEVLGVPDVALDQSFYDLGGDSLSALSVIMRMEALGLDPETARGIFEGKTIAQITGATASPAPAAASAPASTVAAPVASGRTTELQKVWAEVLGVPDVALDQSFYDLGGDSLSALSVIMRMEALGLDPETAQGIFEGKTIAEITGATASPAPAAASGQAAELQKVWAEVLGVPDVALDQSFYDLGGDSLSALTVIMRMEALGLDPETARGIFEGKTITDLTGSDQPVAPAPPVAAAPDPEPKGPVLTLAEAMNAVHATRGVLILWVVVVHWLPGLLGRITVHADAIYTALNPILRFGTPGFAMVFGLGVGALGLAQYAGNKDLFLKGARFNATLIFGGVLLFAFFKFLREWTGGNLGDPELPSTLFYSAVSFYALAMLTMPLIMWLLLRGQNRLLTIFAVLVGALLIHECLAATIAPTRPGGWLELGKILLTAKYGYFRMMVYVMTGVAIGYLFRSHYNQPGLGRDLAFGGLTLFVFGFLLVYEIQPEAMLDNFGQVRPWHLMVYAGIALMILSGFVRLNREGQAGIATWLRWFNAAAIASGILALPIFIGHEIVLPARSFLVNIGMPGSLALLIPLGIFVAAMAFAYVRLMRFLVR